MIANRKVVIVASGALLVAALAILWMKPFARRYQGKTLNEWIDQAPKEDAIRSDVVLTFGKESIPELLAARDRWHWLWALANKISTTAGANPLASIRRSTSHGWNYWRFIVGHPGLVFCAVPTAKPPVTASTFGAPALPRLKRSCPGSVLAERWIILSRTYARRVPVARVLVPSDMIAVGDSHDLGPDIVMGHLRTITTIPRAV